MADLSRSPNLEEDPLHAYSGLSLFPRTLKSLSKPLPPRIYQSDDLQKTHTLLESMPFEIQQEHQEQAKAILEDSSEFFKQGIGTSVASEGTNEGVKINPIPNKRERRPGLERKRGHFTLKPTTSQPPQNEPTFDASKYPKPDEYFAALEKYQNAKREWQKQSGTVVTDIHQNQPSRRPRRPEIPGKKRGSYMHTYTDSYFTDLNASEKENSLPSEQSYERTTAAHVTTADREVNGSAVDTDENLKDILTELLSCSPEMFEGDAGVKLMEERLHIKPVDKEMLSFPEIPEFPDVRKMDKKASEKKPSNSRTALSNIQNLLKGINSDATRNNNQSSSSHPPEDHISIPDRHYLVRGDRQSREADLAKDLNVCFRSPVANDADKVITNASPSNVGETICIASDCNSSVQKSSREDGSDTHSGIHRSHSGPDGNADNSVDDSITNRNSATLEVNVDTQTKGNQVDVPVSESEANRNTGRRENDADINEETERLDNLAEYASGEATRMDHFTVEENNIPEQQDESSKSPNRAPEQYNTMDGSSKSPNRAPEHDAEHVQGEHGEKNDITDTASGLQVENAQQEVRNSSQKQTSKRRKRGGSSDSNMKKRSKTVNDENKGDKRTKTLSHESGGKKKTKRKSNEREEKTQMKKVTREGKIFSRRKSLAAAGTNWESGVRRSTRIKSKPLEYWRGERFLFGRIHESLTTVIGIKYGSPDKGKREKPRVLKVKSFVSDDYKELIDLAALH